MKVATLLTNRVSRTSRRITSRIRRRKTHILLFAVLAMLGACAPLAQVREINPKLSTQYGSRPRLHRAEQAIASGEQLQRTDPNRAIGFYLSAVELATSELRKSAADRVALLDYDFALSRVFSVIRDAHLDPWTHPLHVPAANGSEFILTQQPAKNRLWKAQDYELIPADELDLRGKFVAQRVTRKGIGAPLVAIRNPRAPTIRQPFVPPQVYAATTAVALFGGRQCQVEFVDPLATETARVSGKSLPCAADFTAPIAVGLSREHPEKMGMGAMLDPDKFADEIRLVRVQPYDRNKIPVLFVHGLQSTPVSWVPIINAIWSDPVLRQNYQVWVFSYPSGFPVPYSALLLRRQLEALDKTVPNHRRIVLVGHSMGGILSRLMISDSNGDKVWRYFFGKSPGQTALSSEAKTLVREALIFKPEPSIGRVVFISTPHRGSVIAQGPIGRFASSIIHRSVQLVTFGPEIFRASVVQETDPDVMKLKRMPNSIDTLSPNDAWVKITSTLPRKKGVPYHSIIGDRGRGDTPHSSDGVVPYWSSHLDGAESEKIVPSDHGANENPQAIAEVIRILKQHVTKQRLTRLTPRRLLEGGN
ncbi:MAG: esterase/lipase family protein [Chloroflexota bacterium]